MGYADPAKKSRTKDGAGDGIEKNFMMYGNGPLSEESDIHTWAHDFCPLFCSPLDLPSLPGRQVLLSLAQPRPAQHTRAGVGVGALSIQDTATCSGFNPLQWDPPRDPLRDRRVSHFTGEQLRPREVKSPPNLGSRHLVWMEASV